jgi:1,3-beta-glucanosyltransferase GAS5
LTDEILIGGSSKLTDPIADATICKRDVEEFKKLGINTVRIYTVDNSANHDQCMKMLADAGIYLALDVNSPQYSLNRENSYAIHASYNDVRIISTTDGTVSNDSLGVPPESLCDS